MRKGGIAGNEVAETVGKRVMALTATWPGLNIRWQSGTEVDIIPTAQPSPTVRVS
jgi:hypothetical protein